MISDELGSWVEICFKSEMFVVAFLQGSVMKAEAL
jgi:hypothetical protein